MSTPERPGIYGWDHMVVRLEDFKAGVAAYTKLFPKGPREITKNEGFGMDMAFFDVPNGGFIEVVAPNRPDSVLKPQMEKEGPGLNLMAFQCTDLKATIEMMRANGVKVVERAGQVLVHPSSTHGVLIQLKEKEGQVAATKATKAGQVPDTSGVKAGIVSYKCTVIYVKDGEKAAASYEKLGLKKHFQMENKAANVLQTGFFLRGGGLIELISPLNPKDQNDKFVQFLEKRGEGFQHLSLDASAGAVTALNAAGVKTKTQDKEHTDIDKESTLVGKMLIQLNPVGMGTDEQVDLSAAVAKL